MVISGNIFICSSGKKIMNFVFVTQPKSILRGFLLMINYNPSTRFTQCTKTCTHFDEVVNWTHLCIVFKLRNYTLSDIVLKIQYCYVSDNGKYLHTPYQEKVWAEIWFCCVIYETRCGSTLDFSDCMYGRMCTYY